MKSAIYNMKEQEISLEIDIKTKKIEQVENRIQILYTVVDSNMDYEYIIEMSDERNEYKNYTSTYDKM